MLNPSDFKVGLLVKPDMTTNNYWTLGGYWDPPPRLMEVLHIKGSGGQWSVWCPEVNDIHSFFPALLSKLKDE